MSILRKREGKRRRSKDVCPSASSPSSDGTTNPTASFPVHLPVWLKPARRSAVLFPKMWCRKYTHTHREWRKEIFFFWIVRIRINLTKPWRWISLRRWRKHCWMKKRRGKLNSNLWESVHHLDKALFLNNWMHLGAEILEARMKRRGCDKFKIVYIYHPNKLNKPFLDLRSH